MEDLIESKNVGDVVVATLILNLMKLNDPEVIKGYGLLRNRLLLHGNPLDYKILSEYIRIFAHSDELHKIYERALERMKITSDNNPLWIDIGKELRKQVKKKY